MCVCEGMWECWWVWKSSLCLSVVRVQTGSSSLARESVSVCALLHSVPLLSPFYPSSIPPSLPLQTSTPVRPTGLSVRTTAVSLCAGCVTETTTVAMTRMSSLTPPALVGRSNTHTLKRRCAHAHTHTRVTHTHSVHIIFSLSRSLFFCFALFLFSLSLSYTSFRQWLFRADLSLSLAQCTWTESTQSSGDPQNVISHESNSCCNISKGNLITSYWSRSPEDNCLLISMPPPTLLPFQHAPAPPTSTRVPAVAVSPSPGHVTWTMTVGTALTSLRHVVVHLPHL